MSFLDDESGTDTSRPREFYEIVQSAAVTYRIANGWRDIVYNGDTYTASPVARTETKVDTVEQQQNVTLALPLNHGLCQRWLALAIPPRAVTVTIYRLQLTSGLVERIGGGVITSMAIEMHIGKFAIESQFVRLLSKRLPVVTASRLCPHTLYDVNCRVDRPTFTLGDDGPPGQTVTFFDGRRVIVNTIGGQPDHWAELGELVHLATGERMTIFSQVGNILDMQAPIPGMQVGDAVTISAGCAKDIGTCDAKFGNKDNFGGFPQLPKGTVFNKPLGYGVIT